MRKLLWVGDAACPSGFANSTHGVLETLRKTWDVTVLGMNYRGDPHRYPYPIHTAASGGDSMGYGRLVWMCDHVRQTRQVQGLPHRDTLPESEWSGPDLIVFQNDPWNIPPYLRRLRAVKEFNSTATVGFVAVDGKNCSGQSLEGLDLAIFWTKFGAKEAHLGGFEGPSAIVPLGVNLESYKPTDRTEARRRLGLGVLKSDAFIFGNVNRNQPRKRMDLTVRFFSAWWKRAGMPADAYLYLHVAPTGDSGYDVEQLAEYYGCKTQLIHSQPEVLYGRPEAEMVDTYNSFNAQISTTQGEGFGLTTFEGMACGIPQIVPRWSALEEICEDAAMLVPCTSTSVTIPGAIGVIGGVPDEEGFIRSMQKVYSNAEVRSGLTARGLARVSEPRYRWENIGQRFAATLDELLALPSEEATA